MIRLIFDTANILFRVAAAQGKYNNTGTPEEQAGLAMHMSLNTLKKMFQKYKPDQVAVTFEGFQNWRKEYTRSSACRSGKIYKANRVRDDSMIPFFELMKAFEELARNHTNLICLSNPVLEGDDIFAGYVRRFCEAGDTVIGVSGDKDFVQLLKYKNFSLIDPATGKPRNVEEVCGVDNIDFFMFEKAFRGDRGDNVFPAYPRVQKKRLLKCLTDDFERTKIMNETWSYTDTDTGATQEFVVGELFEENNILMNLECQPPAIRAVIEQSLDTALQNHGKFSHFHFVKFCAKFGLKQIADNATNFADMFSASEAKSERRRTAAEKTSILQF